MSAQDKAKDKLYEAITETVTELRENATATACAEGLKDLAEAYAWLTVPGGGRH